MKCSVDVFTEHERVRLYNDLCDFREEIKDINTKFKTKIEKTATPVITSTDETVNYTIKYEARIAKDYTGKVRVKLTDTLPYEIDTSKENNLNNGTYK